MLEFSRTRKIPLLASFSPQRFLLNEVWIRWQFMSEYDDGDECSIAPSGLLLPGGADVDTSSFRKKSIYLHALAFPLNLSRYWKFLIENP